VVLLSLSYSLQVRGSVLVYWVLPQYSWVWLLSWSFDHTSKFLVLGSVSVLEKFDNFFKTLFGLFGKITLVIS
jgi:hypothetical protein